LTEIVDSFEKLEILVHLHGVGFAPRTAAEIAKGLAISLPEDEIDQCLRAMRPTGVFDPNGPWAPAVEELVEMYRRDRIEVLNLLTKTALERVRKETAQQARIFADAFLIRPKKKGDSDA
jgi:hypothetical protein